MDGYMKDGGMIEWSKMSDLSPDGSIPAWVRTPLPPLKAKDIFCVISYYSCFH